MSNTEQPSVLGELEKLIQKLKKNNKLNKEDCKIAKSLLTEELRTADKLSPVWGMLMTLPAVAAAEAFYDTYSLSDDSKKKELVDCLLSVETFSKSAGLSRSVELLNLFAASDEEVSLQFLLNLSENATDSARKKPSSQLTSLIREKLFAGSKLFRITLTERVNSREITLIAALILAVLTEGPPEDRLEKELYLEWLASSKFPITIPAKLLDELEKETAKWPEDVQELGVSKGVLKTVTRKIVPVTGVPDKKDEINPEDRSKFSAETETKIPDIEVKLNPGDMLKSIGEYIDRLEKESILNSVRTKKLHEQLKMENLRNGDLKRKLEDQQQILHRLEIRAQAAEKELGDERVLTGELKNELTNLKSSYERKLNQLLNQADTESQYAAEEIRNELSSALMPCFNDYNCTKNENMSERLGSYLQSTLKRVFAILENKGVKFERE